MKTTDCTILMGDIIRSRKIENLSTVHMVFNRTVNEINRASESHLLSPLTITLGDEFQGLVKKMTMAFKIVLGMRHSLLLKKIPCRFVIGDVGIKTKVNHKNAWNMMGSGLAEARALLSHKDEVSCYRFSLPGDEKTEILLNAIGACLTSIENKWTDTQLHYVSKVLQKEDVAKVKVAKSLKISQNTLYKVLRSADFALYQQQKAVIGQVLQMIDEEPIQGMSE